MGKISKDVEYLLYFAVQLQRSLYKCLETYEAADQEDYALISIIEEFNKWQKAVFKFLTEHEDEVNQVAFLPILFNQGIPSEEQLERMKTMECYRTLISVESEVLLKKMKVVVEEIGRIFSQQDLAQVRQKVVISKRFGIHLVNNKEHTYRPKPGSKIEKFIYNLRDGGKRVKDLKTILGQEYSTIRRSKRDVNKRCREESLLTEDLIILEDPNYTLNPIFNYEWKE